MCSSSQNLAPGLRGRRGRLLSSDRPRQRRQRPRLGDRHSGCLRPHTSSGFQSRSTNSASCTITVTDLSAINVAVAAACVSPPPSASVRQDPHLHFAQECVFLSAAGAYKRVQLELSLHIHPQRAEPRRRRHLKALREGGLFTGVVWRDCVWLTTNAGHRSLDALIQFSVRLNGARRINARL